MPPSSPPHDTPFLLLFPYPSAYLRPLSLSLSLSSAFFFFSFFLFFLFPFAILIPPYIFRRAFRGDSGNNEWTWKRDGQSYSCSLAGAHLPPVRLACSFGGGGRERGKKKKYPLRRFIPTSLYAVCIFLSFSSILPIFAICCLIASKGNGIVLSTAKTIRDDLILTVRAFRNCILFRGKRNVNDRIKFLGI